LRIVEPPPRKIDLKKDRGLSVEWADGTSSYYSIAYLRKMSPSAEARELREQQRKNPLAVLPAGMFAGGGAGAAGSALTATGAELVGNYAIKILFSDGHATGIYSWEYLRQIDPVAVEARGGGGSGGLGGSGGAGDAGPAGSGRVPVR
jgi:DUF971 family protein